jgi:hypothetical protein
MARSSYPDLAGPGKFSSWVTKKSTTERVRDWTTGETRRRTVDCWDEQGLARTWKERLDAGYAAGLPFDLRTKQFVNPLGVGSAKQASCHPYNCQPSRGRSSSQYVHGGERHSVEHDLP